LIVSNGAFQALQFSFGLAMKKVLNFFSRPEEELKAARTPYSSREPTLNPPPAAAPRNDAPGAKKFVQPDKSSDSISPSLPASPKTESIPTDYAGIVEFFQKKVSERKSPYNGLISAADRLKEFIPDETSRLKAVLAVSSDKWPRDALSLAISAHISDIELARTKARNAAYSQTSDRVAGFQEQAAHLKEQNGKIEDEIHSLNDSIQKLEASLSTNRSMLASLNEKIQLAQANANSVSFIDQAAENLKNDLLAKRVILGLP
jgi:molybdopterin converting factor small subunit